MIKIAKIIDEHTIHIYDKTQFDFYAIRNSGQIFCNPPCVVSQEQDRIIIKATDGVDSKWLWNYFDLDTDYTAVKQELESFSFLKEAIKFGGGIRLLRQPFLQAVVNFIISANNNINRFSKIIEKLDYKKLENYCQDDFDKLGCGYRSAYLVKSIKKLKDFNLENIKQLGHKEFIKELMQLSGVGIKVASCIALFSDILPNNERFKICPVDVHIGRALETLGAKNTMDLLSHKYAGVAQQYIFYYMQHLKKQLK
ncbi:MAG: hypothetical protein FWD32_01255 [Firmicutes bacterium]|nr:hypothetical protein [Bacillota bacterium]